MPVPQAVQEALDKLVGDYDVLQASVGIQTQSYNELNQAQINATLADDGVAANHASVATDLAALQDAIAQAFPN